ncbi:ATP-binding protein [Streptomyces sp. NPDC002992]|uniref:ATP-binding protein n=1 Tax=Streptomyces sp. NPDC002992 TaxID=3154273 RepID=UPI0033B91C2F
MRRHDESFEAHWGLSMGLEVPRFTAHRLRPELSAPASAREFTRDTLRAWGGHVLVEDVVGVVHELVVNAVCHAFSGSHGLGAVWVGLSESAAGIRCTVADPSAAPPRLLAVDVLRPQGRGLRIVDQLSSNWGYRALPLEPGKVVWAQFAHMAPPAATPPSSCGRNA